MLLAPDQFQSFSLVLAGHPPPAPPVEWLPPCAKYVGMITQAAG